MTRRISTVSMVMQKKTGEEQMDTGRMEERTPIDAEPEIIRLKKKCNLLLADLKDKKEQLRRMQQELETQQAAAGKNCMVQDASETEADGSDLTEFIEEFQKIIRIAIERDMFIPFVYNNSPNAQEYEKIDTQDLKALVEKNTQMAMPVFIEYCDLFRLLRRGKKGRHSSVANKTMVYMVSRPIVDHIRKQGRKKTE